MTYLQTVIGLDLYCPDVAGQRPIVSDLRYYIRLHCVSLYALQVYGWSHEDMGPWLFLLWRTVHCIESTRTVLLADYRRLLRHTPLSDHALRPRLFCKYRLQLCDETSDVVLEARIGLEPPQGQIFQALTLAATLTIVGITLKLKAR